MADFVQTMWDWRRMCNEMQLMDGCEDCPIIKNTHRGEVHCVGGETLADVVADVVGISKIAQIVTEWAAENPEPVYPTWMEWLVSIGVVRHEECPNVDGVARYYTEGMYFAIPAETAKKYGIEPKEEA